VLTVAFRRLVTTCLLLRARLACLCSTFVRVHVPTLVSFDVRAFSDAGTYFSSPPIAIVKELK